MKTSVFKYFGPMLVLCTVPVLAKEEWKDMLEAAIRSDIQFTKITNQGSLSTLGTKYTLRVENIHAMPTNGFLPNTNVVDKGVRKEANVGTRALTGLLNASTRKTSGMQIEPESKVGITRLAVYKDSVMVQIVTLKQQKITLKGDTQSEYLYTDLQFPFRDLEAMDASEVKRTVFAVVVPENSITITPLPSSTSSVRASETPPVQNSLVGLTVEQLTKELGNNYTTRTVGARTIYIFSELGVRVPVENGKVIASE